MAEPSAPTIMILVGAALLTYRRTPEADRAARAIYKSVFEAVDQGVTAPDLGAPSTTSAFTDEAIRRVGTKLDVWTALS